ncbi:MAG: hypothetical protein JXB32_25140 [Deltaproteobacteria bacterium]|nr:hypothetical protein [Deltaproteobacteria bacterium]
MDGGRAGAIVVLAALASTAATGCSDGTVWIPDTPMDGGGEAVETGEVPGDVPDEASEAETEAGSEAEAEADAAAEADADVDDGGPCVPSCDGVPCGGDDGCGHPCSGGWRTEHGAVSDCRSPGDCGCGVEDNGNMECTGDGLCRVRCSCDCLPPQDRPASAVAGLDRAEACALVFRESGDPTVWDAATGTALCPLAYDPVGEARCRECPPCHRNHPPECGWAEWCTCRDPRWIDGYRSECCAAGGDFCF